MEGNQSSASLSCVAKVFIGFSALKKRFDTARYGGAVLLGVNAPVVKTHGRSNIRPIYYTLLQIDKMLSQDLVGEYKKYFSESH